MPDDLHLVRAGVVEKEARLAALAGRALRGPGAAPGRARGRFSPAAPGGAGRPPGVSAGPAVVRGASRLPDRSRGAVARPPLRATSGGAEAARSDAGSAGMAVRE